MSKLVLQLQLTKIREFLIRHRKNCGEDHLVILSQQGLVIVSKIETRVNTIYLGVLLHPPYTDHFIYICQHSCEGNLVSLLLSCFLSLWLYHTLKIQLPSSILRMHSACSNTIFFAMHMLNNHRRYLRQKVCQANYIKWALLFAISTRMILLHQPNKLLIKKLNMFKKTKPVH